MEQTDKIRRLSNLFQDIFGQKFQFTPADTRHAYRCGHSQCTEECVCNENIYIQSADEHRWSLVVADLNAGGDQFDAQATVSSLDRDSLVRSANCARTMVEQMYRLEEMNEQLGFFIEQVSGDLEEACWFRKMADEVAACRADDPLERLCERILPQLRSLLHTRTVLVAKLTEHGDVRTVSMDSEEENHHAAEQICHQVIGRFGEKDTEPIIQNVEFSPGMSMAENIGVSGFVLVRIGSPNGRFGWLVALDRRDTLDFPEQSRCSETEFGTHEATLMETAAVLLATHAANCDLFAEQEHTLVGVVTAMVNALDARDPYTRGHSHRVAMIGQKISQHLGLTENECEDIYLSGLLHDVGKIGVSDHVLLKDGPLNEEERRHIEEHTIIGHTILTPVKQLRPVLEGVLHHHERIDGKGYPRQLTGENIPLVGRILSVADAYDAMTTSRPYRKAMPVEHAEQILLEGVGTQWDERVIDAFFSIRPEVHEIYRRDEIHESNIRQSLLQHARFEDASQGLLNSRGATATYGTE